MRRGWRGWRRLRRPARPRENVNFDKGRVARQDVFLRRMAADLYRDAISAEHSAMFGKWDMAVGHYSLNSRFARYPRGWVQFRPRTSSGSLYQNPKLGLILRGTVVSRNGPPWTTEGDRCAGDWSTWSLRLRVPSCRRNEKPTLRPSAFRLDLRRSSRRFLIDGNAEGTPIATKPGDGDPSYVLLHGGSILCGPPPSPSLLRALLPRTVSLDPLPAACLSVPPDRVARAISVPPLPSSHIPIFAHHRTVPLIPFASSGSPPRSPRSSSSSTSSSNHPPSTPPPSVSLLPLSLASSIGVPVD